MEAEVEIVVSRHLRRLGLVDGWFLWFRGLRKFDVVLVVVVAAISGCCRLVVHAGTERKRERECE